MFKIESYDPFLGWTDDVSLLGGFAQDDNCWITEAEAEAACDELASVGFSRHNLRVEIGHA